ncbi:helix-turn-helix domain-containing protein [Curtobacterium sp. VKM Ac-1376]|uniref:helix-turn-helix domain-containing protein n=1 Tax=Curtobacterium sp. VKM Ac-1376 TaxID=123312 RepID=UPI00188A7E6C|nr:hypothetical protein [Curtobacterium sp. VKM Ac-1376]MBF4613773.1 hypothetical protein [Curtobacterium sp. VKM Ac-1376]
MTVNKNRAGASLKHLRTSHNVSQPLVAAMAGTSTAYLAKVEDGLFNPARSYVGKVTEAICRLMKDPPRPCPTLGCDGTKHIDTMTGTTAMPGYHHADHAEGDGWTIDVAWFDEQDSEWSVYTEVSDDFALTPDSFLALTDAYKKASAYAAVLNGKGAKVTR